MMLKVGVTGSIGFIGGHLCREILLNDNRFELIAFNRTHEEISNKIEADLVIYNDLVDVMNVCSKISHNCLTNFETSCFNGKYLH